MEKSDLYSSLRASDVLNEMDTELAVLEQRRIKAQSLKEAMMQELLTGKTRLL